MLRPSQKIRLATLLTAAPLTAASPRLSQTPWRMTTRCGRAALSPMFFVSLLVRVPLKECLSDGCLFDVYRQDLSEYPFVNLYLNTSDPV